MGVMETWGCISRRLGAPATPRIPLWIPVESSQDPPSQQVMCTEIPTCSAKQSHQPPVAATPFATWFQAPSHNRMIQDEIHTVPSPSSGKISNWHDSITLGASSNASHPRHHSPPSSSGKMVTASIPETNLMPIALTCP